MEGKAAMRVIVKTIMAFLLIAFVAGQATIPNLPIPNTPTNPAGGLPPPAPAIPGAGGAGDQLPPDVDTGVLLPGDGVPIPFPYDLGIPGFDFGHIDMSKRKCLSPCLQKCRTKRRIRFGCSALCYLKCGIRISDDVLGCTSHCANSVSPTAISDDRDAQSVVNSCFQRCNNS